MSHPFRDALIGELQSNNPCTPFSEESKHRIHSLGNVESFELRQVSLQIQFPQRMKCLMGRILCCDCGTGLLPSEEARRLNKERNDDRTIPSSQLKTEQPGELVTVAQKIKRRTIKPGKL